MASEPIYEKKYPNPWDEDEPLESIPQEAAAVSARKLIESTVQVLMPERMELLPHFLETAKEIGERYEIDTSIMEYDDSVTVSYVLQIDVPYACLMRIITLADELSLLPKTDTVTLTLTYFTHATYCGGRKLTLR